MVNGGITGEFRQVGLEAVVRGIDAYKRNAGEIKKQQKEVGDSAEKTADRTEAAARRQVAAWQTIGRTAVIAGGAIVAALGAATVATIRWEQSFVQVEKTVDGTSAQLQQIERDILGLSEVIPISAGQLAETAALAGQLGIATEDIVSFTETVSKLGTATDLSAQQAAVSLAQLINVTGDSVDQVEAIASTLVDLGNNSATTESQILRFAQRIAATGTNVGLTTQEILALSTTVLSLGINIERGATAVGQGLIAMQSAVAQGGEELRVFADTAGLSSLEFQRLFREDALAAFQAFVQGLGQSGEQASRILDDVGLGGFRATDAFQALGRAQDQLTASTLRANSAFERNVALQEEFDRFASTTAAQLTIAFNKFLNVVREVGAEFIPLLMIGIDLLGTFLELWQGIPAPIRSLIILFTGFTAVLLIFVGVAFLIKARLFEMGQAALQAQISVGGLAIRMQLLVPVIGVVSALLSVLTLALISSTNETDAWAAAQVAVTAALDRHIARLEKLEQDTNLIITTSRGYLKILERTDENLQRVADGTAELIDVTILQLKQIRELVSVGVAWSDAVAIVTLRTSENTEEQRIWRQALEGAADAASTDVNKLLALVDATGETGDATAAAAGELREFGDQADITSAKIARLSSRAVALKRAFEIVGIQIAQERGELVGFEQDVAFALDQATQSARAQVLVTRELEFRAEEFADALIAEADALLGITEASLQAAAAGQAIAGSFDEAVQAIETARAQLALGLLLDELRAVGGNREALALTVLLASQAETGSQIVAGIRKIAELFPNVANVVQPTGAADDRGLALLLSLLGTAGGGGGVPGFQRGGLVRGGPPGTPVPAILHMGEFVLPREAAAALMSGGGGAGAGARVTVEANYWITQTPIMLRHDMERLRMAGVFG